MTVWKRIETVLMALVQLFRVVILLCDPVRGKNLVIGTFQIQLVLLGIRYLVFYFTMARHMVDGRAILYRGGIYLDLGIFLGFTHSVPSAWIMLYLVTYFLVNAGYRCLKLRDTLKLAGEKWIPMAIVGLWYLVLAVIGAANLRSGTVMINLFCVELVLTTIPKLVRAFRKTAIVYIQ